MYKQWRSTDSIKKRFINPDGKFVVTEKLHGTNFQIWTDIKDGQVVVRYGSRHQILDDKATFFNYKDIIAVYSSAIDALTRFAKERGVSVNMYGELCGDHVFNRVRYPKGFYAFAVIIDGIEIPFTEWQPLLSEMGFDIVPVIGTNMSLEEILALDLDITTACKSRYTTSSGMSDGIEGVVVTDESILEDGSFVRYKIKTGWFLGSKDSKKPQLAKNPHFIESVITEANLETFVSKYGRPTCEQELGRFIPLFMDELVEDIMNDHPDLAVGMSPKDIRRAVGHKAASLLKWLINGGAE